MDSLQKQSLPEVLETPEAFVAAFERKLQESTDLAGLEVTMKMLKYLGLNYDPFNPEISTECQQIMDGLGLTQHLSNPYLATNILLRLLDKTEEHLNNLKQ